MSPKPTEKGLQSATVRRGRVKTSRSMLVSASFFFQAARCWCADDGDHNAYCSLCKVQFSVRYGGVRKHFGTARHISHLGCIVLASKKITRRVRFRKQQSCSNWERRNKAWRYYMLKHTLLLSITSHFGVLTISWSSLRVRFPTLKSLDNFSAHVQKPLSWQILETLSGYIIATLCISLVFL